MTKAAVLASSVALVVSQSACIVVGGYSTDRGFFVWPGSIVLGLILLLVLFVMRRGRR